MKNWIKSNFVIFRRIIIILVLSFLLILLTIFQNSPDICEWWTRTFSRFFQTGIGFIIKWIPFSIVELCVLFLIGFGIYLIVRIIIDLCKKRWTFAAKKGLLIGIISLSIVVTYVSTTSLAYYRKEMPITLYEEKVDKSKFAEVTQYFLDDFNACSSSLTYEENGEVIMPYDTRTLFNNLAKEYEKLDDPYFSSFTTNPKPLLTSFLYREFQITGVYTGPTGEVNYNAFMTNGEFPFTLAHELAHSKGVMRENDAQLLAAYICLNSDDTFIRYSGYLYTFASFLNIMRYTGNKDDYSNMSRQLNEEIFANFDYINEYWAKHNLLETIGEFFNNLYLNIFGSESTEDYDDTPTIVDPGTQEITSFSRYQKLYFQKYIDEGYSLK